MSTEHEYTHFGYENVTRGEKTRRVNGVFDSVASKYDLMNDLMSAGLHRLWKRRAVLKLNCAPSMKVLDLAGGTGDISKLISPQIQDEGQIVLCDINRSMILEGVDKLVNSGISNVTYVQASAEQLPFEDNTFDRIIIAFGLRNFTSKEKALLELLRILKPGGKLLVCEFSELQIKPLKPLYDWYSFKALPFLGKVTVDDADSYNYLAESIRKHPNQEKFITMMQEAGFEQCRYTNLSGGLVALHEGFKL